MTETPSLQYDYQTPPEPAGYPVAADGQDAPAAALGTQQRPGAPAAAPPRRVRKGLIIGIAAALLVLVGGGSAIGVALLRTSAGGVTLPGKLLNLDQYAGPGARNIDSRLTRAFAGSSPYLVHPTASIYSGPAGRWFLVIGAGYSVLAHPVSAAELTRRFASINGITDVRQFPPGAKGGSLVCGYGTLAGTAVIGCLWADSKSVGIVVYHSVFASGLADAAAKTNQIRAAAEH